jgi:hypothetical protein
VLHLHDWQSALVVRLWLCLHCVRAHVLLHCQPDGLQWLRSCAPLAEFVGAPAACMSMYCHWVLTLHLMCDNPQSTSAMP